MPTSGNFSTPRPAQLSFPNHTSPTPPRPRPASCILEYFLTHASDQPEYFGQYGEITKLVVNHHRGVAPDDPRHGSASAYITFRRSEDAWAAICSVDGFRLMGRTIRASFGTTKYCHSFLFNLACKTPDCLYLHELGDQDDRLTKVCVLFRLFARARAVFATSTVSTFRANGAKECSPDNARSPTFYLPDGV